VAQVMLVIGVRVGKQGLHHFNVSQYDILFLLCGHRGLLSSYKTPVITPNLDYI
jgi:hypothetical protein